ncbi:MAG TPA: dienelactone hydrolase family protein [Chloroflexota bacterium]|nr:dienelactone hydrolase family protein [Chloroflexota bacterium]
MNEFQRYSIWEFVEDYKSGQLSRRDLMRRVMYITGGVASAASVLALMGCGTASAPASSAAAPTSAASKLSAAASGGASAGGSAASAGGSGAASAASGSTAGSAAASAAASPASSAAAKPAGSASAKSSAAPQPTPSGPKSPLSVPANDPAIDGKDITFQGNGATLMAYEVRPKNATGPLALVMVCEENMGLTEHIRDVTRRFAKAGYMAAALDLLSREGGTAKVEPARIPSLLGSGNALATNQAAQDFKALADYYMSQPDKPVAIGMNGYCFGGTITYRAIEVTPSVKAAVAFYGSVPPLDLVKDIKAAVLGVYSSDPQDAANKNRDELEAAMKAANVTFQYKVYPGTTHAFNNDTRPTSPPGNFYNQEQALAAWKDMLDWFGKYLKA